MTYRLRGGDGVDHKVVQHVIEYGHITNQTLRRLFDLNVYQSRDLQRDMQTRELLRKIDDKTAGPGFRYGPGRKFHETTTEPTNKSRRPGRMPSAET